MGVLLVRIQPQEPFKGQTLKGFGYLFFNPKLNMNETLTKFMNSVADSTNLQEKLKAGADLVALGKDNGYEFTQEELETGWEELQESDEELTDFECREYYV